MPLRSIAAITVGIATHGIESFTTALAVYLTTDGILCVR